MKKISFSPETDGFYGVYYPNEKRVDKAANTRYLEMAMQGIPEGFDGSLLKVPVGSDVLTMPLYRMLHTGRFSVCSGPAFFSAAASISKGKTGTRTGLSGICTCPGVLHAAF